MLVLIDAKGIVQSVRAGLSAGYAERLREDSSRSNAGKDLAAEYLRLGREQDSETAG